MKRYAVAGLLTLLSLKGAQAQVFTLGPKAGINFSRIQVEPEFTPDGLSVEDYPDGREVGVTAGMFLQFNAGPFVFQPELMFSVLTGKVAFQDLGVSDITRVRFNQVDIPLLAGFNICRQVRIQAGPVMSYVLDVHTQPGAAQVLNAFVNDFGNKSWGYQAGIGLDLGRLALDVRYGGPLSKETLVFDVGGTLQPVQVAQNQLQVTAGINLIR
jgi:hypothetical protein